MEMTDYQQAAVQDISDANVFTNVEEQAPVPDASVVVHKQEKTLLEKLGFKEKKSSDDINIPEMSYIELFMKFLWFGCRAFGGPVAQIQMMKQEMVTEKKWISNERFNRVYSVYQVLPGPEATELACYFGYVSKGRFGAFLGGLGFLIPGFLGMLLWSYIYVNYGIDNEKVNYSFRAVQNAVAAIIFRATYKLAEGALKDKKKEFSWEKGFLTFLCFLTSVINLNFFIALAVCGVINTMYKWEKLEEMYRYLLCFLLAAGMIGFYILYVVENGAPSASLIGGNVGATGTTYTDLLELGLIAGMVTFGGAYTTLPFIYASAVGQGWLTQRAFLDAIAITNMMPTPLVTFVTMVGFIGHGIGGSILMTIGIFLPAFSFTIIGHEVFEMLVENEYIEEFLDGIAAAVIGLLLYTAFQFVSSVITCGIDAVAFLLAFAAAFHFTHKYTQPLILAFAAVAGQVLYLHGCK